MPILRLNVSNIEVKRTTTPYSVLSSQVAAGATTSDLQNVAGFDDGYFILFGEPSGEKSELVSITSISGNTVTHPALSFAHSASTPVYCVAYDQVKIYRKRDDTITLVSTVDMQFGSSKNTTEFYGDAQVGDEFATSYFNSETSAETDKSEWVSMDGYEFNSKHGMAVRAAKLFNDKTQRAIDFEDWYTWQHEAIGQLIRKAQDKDQNYTLTSIEITDVTEADDFNSSSVVAPTDMRTLKMIWVKYASGQYRTAYPEDVQDGAPMDYYSQNAPSWAFDGDNLQIRPGSVQSVMLRYYPVISPLSDYNDIPVNPVRFYDYAIVDYMLLRAFAFERDEEMIEFYQNRWDRGVAEFLSEIDKRQRDRPRKIVQSNPVFSLTRDSESYI